MKCLLNSDDDGTEDEEEDDDDDDEVIDAAESGQVIAACGQWSVSKQPLYMLMAML